MISVRNVEKRSHTAMGNEKSHEKRMVLDEILEKCNEIQRYLQENGDPYITVCIAADSMRVERTEEFIPFVSSTNSSVDR